METKNKNKKKAIMLAVIGIAIVCICVIGVFAKKAYDRHQEELRLQAIETKNSEIDEEYQRFEKGEDRDKKLEALKQEMESAEKYKKTEGAYKECSVHYEKIIAQMKNSFVSEYDDTIKIIADKIGDDVEKVDDKEALKNATSEFTTFKDILKNDFENYNTVEQDSFDKYNSTIDDYVTKYNDRVTAIEKAEEEARKKAEEEAKKKAEEEAAAKAAQEEAERKAVEQSSGSSSGGSSYSYDDSNDYSYSSGSSSSDYSGVLAIVILDLLVLEMITVVGQAHLAEAQVIFIMNGMVDGLMKKAMNIMIITIQIQEIHMIPMEIIKEI